MLLLSSKSYKNSKKPKDSTVFNLVDLHLQTAMVNYENQNLSYYFSCLNVRRVCFQHTHSEPCKDMHRSYCSVCK